MLLLIMIFGDSVHKKKKCFVIDHGYFNGHSNAKIFHIFAERVNIAANAIIAQQAAAARLLLASQSLAKCREETNPYLPGNRGPFGPSRQQIWGPDPCATQEKELAGATTDHMAATALAQHSAAPTAQDVQAAPAPQLSEAWVGEPLLDPAIPESEVQVPSPALSNDWSPTTLLQVMDMIAEQMEADEAGSTASEAMEEELELVFQNMYLFLSWDAWKRPKRSRRPFQYLPNNADWIGSWLP
nr:nonstructural protein 2 [Psittaciform chaphamaparvovirus 5]